MLESNQYITLTAQNTLLAIAQADDKSNLRVIKAFTTPEEIFGEHAPNSFFGM